MHSPEHIWHGGPGPLQVAFAITGERAVMARSAFTTQADIETVADDLRFLFARLLRVNTAAIDDTMLRGAAAFLARPPQPGSDYVLAMIKTAELLCEPGKTG